MTLNALRAGCAVVALFAASSAFAAAQCTSDVRVLAQPRDGLTLLEKYVDEFEELSGAGFEISYLNENDRRAKSQADASTVGSFNVYYVDEANLALFAFRSKVFTRQNTTTRTSTPACAPLRPTTARSGLHRYRAAAT